MVGDGSLNGQDGAAQAPAAQVPEPRFLPAWFRESSCSVLWGAAGVAAPTSCAICQEEFREDSICRKLIPCAHIFHDSCIIDWWSRRATCPLCRRAMTVSRGSVGLESDGQDAEAQALSRAIIVIVQEVRATASALSSSLLQRPGGNLGGMANGNRRNLAQVSEALRTEVGRVRRQLDRVSEALHREAVGSSHVIGTVGSPVRAVGSRARAVPSTLAPAAAEDALPPQQMLAYSNAAPAAPPAVPSSPFPAVTAVATSAPRAAPMLRATAGPPVAEALGTDAVERVQLPRRALLQQQAPSLLAAERRERSFPARVDGRLYNSRPQSHGSSRSPSRPPSRQPLVLVREEVADASANSSAAAGSSAPRAAAAMSPVGGGAASIAVAPASPPVAPGKRRMQTTPSCRACGAPYASLNAKFCQMCGRRFGEEVEGLPACGKAEAFGLAPTEASCRVVPASPSAALGAVAASSAGCAHVQRRPWTPPPLAKPQPPAAGGASASQGSRAGQAPAAPPHAAHVIVDRGFSGSSLSAPRAATATAGSPTGPGPILPATRCPPATSAVAGSPRLAQQRCPQ